ncbi:hypothetical protein B566_EDAN004407 [Ephemera danica]|nr:hypothetical protein B566_EDAN004407 [Ephemera danica]
MLVCGEKFLEESVLIKFGYCNIEIKACATPRTSSGLALVVNWEYWDYFLEFSCDDTGHKGKFGHEFLEFEFRPDGKLRYANNSNYKNDTMIRKEAYVHQCVMEELKRVIHDSEIMQVVLVPRLEPPLPHAHARSSLAPESHAVNLHHNRMLLISRGRHINLTRVGRGRAAAGRSWRCDTVLGWRPVAAAVGY